MDAYNDNYDFINKRIVPIQHAAHDCVRLVDIARGSSPSFTVTTYLSIDSNDCLCQNSPYILRYGL